MAEELSILIDQIQRTITINLETVTIYEDTDDIHTLILGRHQTGISAF